MPCCRPRYFNPLDVPATPRFATDVLPSGRGGGDGGSKRHAPAGHEPVGAEEAAEITEPFARAPLRNDQKVLCSRATRLPARRIRSDPNVARRPGGRALRTSCERLRG